MPRGQQGGERYLGLMGLMGLGVLVGNEREQGEDKHGTCGEKVKRRKVEDSWCGEPPASETLGPFPSPVAARSVPSWGGVT